MSETVAGLFRAAAAKHPERPFLNVLDGTAKAYGIEAGEITYGAMAAWVDRLTTVYGDAGYGAGDRVFLALENRPSLVAHFMALNAVGASIVPINPDLRRAELWFLIGHAEPRIAVATAQRAPDITAADETGTLPVIGEADVPPAKTPSPIGQGRAEDEAALLYTSGTTGTPKGCVLSNRYFAEAGRWYASAGGLCALEDGDRMLTPLPLFHMNALAYSLMAMVAVGGCLSVLDRFHPRAWWADVVAAQADCIHYLGVMPAMLMTLDPSPQERAHKVRFGFGAGVEGPLHAPFEARFGFPLVEAWAMTETGAGVCIAANHPPRVVGTKCFGREGPEVDLRIVDEVGHDTDGEGELLVRRKGDDPRYGFFSRYHKDRAATEAVWAGGHFHTGDVVRRGPQGLIFVDRKKNVIRRSGENIAAVEVEGVLNSHPAVKAAAVTSVADDVRGEEVFACLRVEAVADRALGEAIVAWCLEELAYYKAPGYVAFVDALPVTATQKVQRGALKDLAGRLVSAPATFDFRAMKAQRRG